MINTFKEKEEIYPDKHVQYIIHGLNFHYHKIKNNNLFAHLIDSLSINSVCRDIGKFKENDDMI